MKVLVSAAAVAAFALVGASSASAGSWFNRSACSPCAAPVRTAPCAVRTAPACAPACPSYEKSYTASYVPVVTYKKVYTPVYTPVYKVVKPVYQTVVSYRTETVRGCATPCAPVRY